MCARLGLNKLVPDSAQLLQFRHLGSVGFYMKRLVLVQDFLYLGRRQEWHGLTLEEKNTRFNTEQSSSLSSVLYAAQQWKLQLWHNQSDTNKKQIFGKGFMSIKLQHYQPPVLDGLVWKYKFRLGLMRQWLCIFAVDNTLQLLLMEIWTKWNEHEHHTE